MLSSSNWESLEDCQGENFVNLFPGLYLHPGYYCFETGARSWYSWKEVSFSKGCTDFCLSGLRFGDWFSFPYRAPFSYKISIFVGSGRSICPYKAPLLQDIPFARRGEFLSFLLEKF